MLAERSGVGPGGVLRHPPRGALCFVRWIFMREKFPYSGRYTGKVENVREIIAKNGKMEF